MHYNGMQAVLLYGGLMFALAIPANAADWPNFLGLEYNGTSPETNLQKQFDFSAPPIRWTRIKGESYSAPSIKNGRLIYHHRTGDVERVECINAGTGELLWSGANPTAYRDRYNYLNGPRSTPAIDGDHVFTLGVEGVLSCFDIKSGLLRWRRMLATDFKLGQGFFGFATSPLVEDDLVILNLGMKKCVAAFDKHTGATRWVSGGQWGRSYASPIATTVHDRRVLFVLAGGESNPTVGGLLCLDPQTGKILARFPWRSSRYSSVNSSTPVVSGSDVFISSSYDIGGAMLEVQPDFSFKLKYTTKAFASHWATPILKDGYLYGFANNKLTCMEWKTGRRVWRKVLKLAQGTDHSAPQCTGRGADQYRDPPGDHDLGIGSLIYADGHFLCLGENGLLAWLDLSPERCRIISSTRVFNADQSWTAPVLSDSLVYVTQSLPGKGMPPRLICLDLERKPKQEVLDGPQL
jgi:outer membrane protein assembly factor BamB